MGQWGCIFFIRFIGKFRNILRVYVEAHKLRSLVYFKGPFTWLAYDVLCMSHVL